ncbi:MAG TPA: hypothetical protein PKD59_15165 [Miltoncostaeaceae bacterium]|nr:hypothetical protein [Miltoncostaeaceae bacterium]
MGRRRSARWGGIGGALVGVAWGVVPAVAAAAWSAPQDIAPADSLTDGHRALAVDARGSALALLDYGELRYAEQSADGAWSVPRSLGPAFGAGLVTTPAESLVVWTDGRGDVARVLTASRSREGAWSPVTDIGPASSRYARVGSLSADADGNVVVGLVDSVDPPYPSVVLARAGGGPWIPLDLGPVAPWARVVAHDGGAMTAAWRDDAPDDSPGRGRLRLAERAPGGAFAEVPSPTGAQPVALRALAGTPGGDALLVASPPDDTYTAWLRPAGGSFGPPRTIDGRVWGAGVAAMGADGTAAIAWAEPGRGGRLRGIRVLLRLPGEGFGTPIAISSPAPAGEVTGPLVAVGPDGGVVVAWSELRRSGLRRVAGTVWAAVRPPGGAFRRAAVLNDRSLPAHLHHVASGPGGASVVTWAASTGRGYVLQAARSEPRPLLARMTGWSREGDARVRLRLAEEARVTVRLLLPTGRLVARRTRSLPAGGSTVEIAGDGALARGRYRLQVAARGAGRTAGASAHLRVGGLP